MVQDIRRIIMNIEELTSAIESYRRITPNFLPNGVIAGCSIADNNEIIINLSIPAGSATQKTDIKLSAGDMLIPLIRFCIENNIMLPRDGRKSVSVSQGKVSLCVSLDLDVDLSETISHMNTTQLKALALSEMALKARGL